MKFFITNKSFPFSCVASYTPLSHTSFFSTNEKTINNNYLNTNVSNILNQLYTDHINSKFVANYESQKTIELLTFNEYDVYFNNLKPYKIGNLSISDLSPQFNKYIIDKSEEFLILLEKLLTIKIKNENDKLSLEILNTIGPNVIYSRCFYYYLKIATHQDTDYNEEIYMISVTLNLGRSFIKKYISILKDREDKNAKFSIWYEQWKINNQSIYEILDNDEFKAYLGSKLIDILEACDMISKKLLIKAKDNKQYILCLKNKNLLDNKKMPLFNLPLKLPMIVKPNKYDKNNIGGYLLNDINYSDDLIINKAAYGSNSIIQDNNMIYNMINNVSCVAYKINIDVLNYIIDNPDNLLIDIKIPHKFEYIKKKSKYQQKCYSSHKSKIILQETILGIADFYKNFSEIYFPLIIDQRGRIYCISSYFNYQSNELSKALLLFANPSIINKKDLSSIKYLEAYGASCFGKDKLSFDTKIKWVKDNIDNIINYENNILLNKAKDKLLFLAFCIEYKRYQQFINNENLYEFSNHLPVQLDATCNGFQHMALLSNEKQLFKVLNLVKDDEDTKPKDFYNFLLHKLIILFDQKIESNENICSYKRLRTFVWERSHIKKAIMTIPYNVSTRSMIDYVKSCLYLVDIKDEDKDKDEDEDKIFIYSASESECKPWVLGEDIKLLVADIRSIILKDFNKIKRMTKYLKNIATVLTALELPITWSLPHGLTVKQSYLKTKSTSIEPFMYSKIKINIKIIIKDEYDRKKQIRALMPNLIHSLDGTSLCLLYQKFFNLHLEANPQFFSIHDCFGTTVDKVDSLKVLLASVYTELYSDNHYLDRFDKSILNLIEENVEACDFNRSNRTVKIKNKNYRIHDIEWVKDNTNFNQKLIKQIDS